MGIDPDIQNAKSVAAPTQAVPIRKHRRCRQLSPPQTRQAIGPKRHVEATSAAIGLVPEARQTYPTEDADDLLIAS
ncbi:MAG: hypothetical protein ACRECO_09695 [Xanthobacteraceae bacterium]